MKCKIIKTGLIIGLSILFMTGCSDMIEIQERDFVLALGVSYADDQYQLTYSLPDLGAITGEGTGENDRLIRTWSGASFPEVNNTYNQNADKRLDYRHLQALILDRRICNNEEKLEELIRYLEEDNEISRNVIIYYYDDDIKALFEDEGTIGGSIGDYLSKLNSNYNNKRSIEAITLGNLVDGLYSNETLAIPALKEQEGAVAISGAAMIRNCKYEKLITEEERDLLYITCGNGKDYLIHTPSNELFRLEELKNKTDYRMENDQPHVDIQITGTAKRLSSQQTLKIAKLSDEQFSAYMESLVMAQIKEHIKYDGLDYLNIYEKSGTKSRNVWITYRDRAQQFAEDVVVNVTFDLKIKE